MKSPIEKYKRVYPSSDLNKDNNCVVFIFIGAILFAFRNLRKLKTLHDHLSFQNILNFVPFGSFIPFGAFVTVDLFICPICHIFPI